MVDLMTRTSTAPTTKLTGTTKPKPIAERRRRPRSARS